MWPKPDELIPQTKSVLGVYQSKVVLFLWADCWSSLCVQAMQGEVQENPTADTPCAELTQCTKQGINTHKPEQCETLECGTQPRPCHKGVPEAQSEKLLMSITRQNKSFPSTLILWCHPYYKLPLSFSYLKTPKQACHALLLLALQSHHSDRY